MDDRITCGTTAHAADPHENPLDHIGEQIADPWDDPEQNDWTTPALDLGEPAAGSSGTWVA